MLAIVFAVGLTFLVFVNSSPFNGVRSVRRISSEEWDASSDEFPEDSLEVVPLNITNSTNITAQNLYVIKAVVYEIGILTNVDENDTTTNETLKNEQVDFTFFNPDRNGSIIDLGNIPVPIQTNISGQVITGIAPIDLGSFSAPQSDIQNISTENVLAELPFADSLQHLVPTVSIITFSDSSSSNASQSEESKETGLKAPQDKILATPLSIASLESSVITDNHQANGSVSFTPLLSLDSVLSELPIPVLNQSSVSDSTSQSADKAASVKNSK